MTSSYSDRIERFHLTLKYVPLGGKNNASPKPWTSDKEKKLVIDSEGQLHYAIYEACDNRLQSMTMLLKKEAQFQVNNSCQKYWNVLIRNVLDFPKWIVIPNVETGGKQENYWSAQCSRLLLEVCSVMYPHKNAIPQRSPTKRKDLETSGENEGVDKLQSVRSGKIKQSQVKALLRHRAE